MGVGLQKEREAMQEEIRALYDQEQRRFREELRMDRQFRAAQDAFVDPGH
jgi:hypothetical protein